MRRVCRGAVTPTMARWSRSRYDFQRRYNRDGRHANGREATRRTRGEQREPLWTRELRRLGEFRDAGIVTPGEFEAKKAELLARM